MCGFLGVCEDAGAYIGGVRIFGVVNSDHWDAHEERVTGGGGSAIRKGVDGKLYFVELFVEGGEVV